MSGIGRREICQTQEFLEAKERVKEERALLFDLERATPEDPDRITKQRAAHRAAIQFRREVLRRLMAELR